MDFSRLHTYTPPQCVPENTGYTYALSSSYSSTALDFETEHKLEPVFDSPRMSRRSLRSSATACSTTKDTSNENIYVTGGSNSSYAGKKAFVDQSPKITKQHKSVAKQSGSIRYTSRKNVPSSSIFSHSSFSSQTSDGSLMSTILDESSIQEQTAVDHFWGLDDDGDLKGGGTTVIQANGDIVTTENQTSLSNGYTCNDCSMLSERKEVLTAYSTPHMPPSRIYSRDRNQKHKSRGLTFYTSKILQVAKYTTTSFTSLIVQLFQMILLKLGYDCKAHSNYCGSMNVKEFLREDGHLGMNGESLSHLVHLFSSREGSCRSILVAWNWMVSTCYPDFFAECVYSYKMPSKDIQVIVVSSPTIAVASIKYSTCFLGLWHWGPENFLSLLPSWNWTRLHRTYRWEDSVTVIEPHPDSSYAVQHPDETMKFFDASRVRELEKQMALISERWHHRDEEYSKMLLLLQNFQDQVTQMNDKSEMLILIKNIVGQHLKEMKPDQTMNDFLALHQEHEGRIGALEDLLAKLSERSEVDAQVKESVKVLFFGNQQGDLPDSLLQWLTSKFVSKSDLRVLLQDLELQILKNISLHMSVSNAKSTSEVVKSVVNEAGIAGITEAQAHIIVNNALKLFSQDKTGMVDFALESGGGSILSTRCSETYETKTALISLFGIPLWYFSQSPRVVIQPDMYPGNCWAFKGSQGYLVVRLSMMIYPTAFTLEHIPKTLSPTGNITSAPKDFSVYGLEDEYQEEGVLLGQYMYNQDEEPLQMFQVTEATEKAFQIVELRIFSNWGHTEYTCLYRFRVHGRPSE
ncbi:hypothetical protein JD844_019905 [Phrynosoma platyrhinos]|uniref:SUN domain-containing protein n=1 Tax=Phrynosoma platyrhinos TaxID=52577 RepID=A0ABQ7TRC8_PHRPL|nr:hypothetical protein JD844_019905 [Phrynosoma platyrhinos]